MIVVDSSVWIGAMRGDGTRAVEAFREVVRRRLVLVGDLILLEVLQGARGNAHAALLERNLRQFAQAEFLNADIAVKAASNYRHLRAAGITIRRSNDLIIATFCIENDHQLLQQDRDFRPFAQHLGLRLI
jgi:predicted nucleic acid-binding protein